MKKKVLAALLAVCMVASMLMPAAAATTFTDVDADAWYASSIERWTEYGILNGKGDGVFAPEKQMTRAEFAKVIVTLLGLPVDEDAECPFEDVKGTNDEWAIPYIVAAYKAGIIGGYADGTFGGSKPVTFAAGATMLSRALGLATIEETSGDKYQTGAADKLKELGLLDENVNAEMDFNRAGVAALADNMIGVYVTMDNIDEVTESGVITGEVKGVVLVVGSGDGVAVTVKDATVPAIVMNGGNVTVSGETTVDTVKVGGESASVKAEEGTTIGSVTVGGENAKVELKGEVTEVVVAEDAAGEPEIVVPEGVDVANNSTVDVTVNGETVAGKPVEENPGEDKDDTNNDYENWDGGFTSTPSDKENPEPTVAEKKEQQETSKDDPGKTVPGDGACSNHVWGDKDSSKCVAATCTIRGKDVYKCTGTVTVEEDGADGTKTTKQVPCTAVKEVTVPALGHSWGSTITTAATCTTDGVLTWKCANDEDCDGVKDGTTDNTEVIAKLGHISETTSGTAATCENMGWGSGIKCKRTGCEKGGETLTAAPTVTVTASKWLAAPKTIDPLGHVYVADTTNEETGVVTQWKCTRDASHTTTECPNKANHKNIDPAKKCPTCKAPGEKTETPAHTHNWATAWTGTTAHWHECQAADCNITADADKDGYHTANWGNGNQAGTRTCQQSGCNQTTTCSKAKDHPAQAGENAFTCSECSYHVDAATVVDPQG